MTHQLHTTAAPTDSNLLHRVEAVATEAAARLLPSYSPSNRPVDRATMVAAAQANETASSPGLRSALHALRPDARWVEGEQETAALPPGEWWVVDTVEGNVNHIHGLPEWCVSIALVRDGIPVLAVVRQPIGDRTFTALLGGGAFVNGERLQVSEKEDLTIAVVGTGQAEAEQKETYQRIGKSITVMLDAALMVRAQVPSTFPILLVAAGHTDAFWQYEPNLPGVAAGVLFTSEAGGTVSAIDGSPWKPGADSILLAAPGVYEATREALAGVA